MEVWPRRRTASWRISPGQRFGNVDGGAAKAEAHPGGSVADGGERESRNPGERLSVKEHQAARDAVDRVVPGAVQQIPGDAPPVVGVGQGHGSVSIPGAYGDLDVADVAA
jgi:hypothetical protein